MTRRLFLGLGAVLAVVCVSRPFAQEREDRTLLTHDQMRAIVSEASGELVDVGLGTRAEDYNGKDVKGKIAIGSGSVAQIYAQASQRGAIGAVGYSTRYPDRGVDVIPSSSIMSD